MKLIIFNKNKTQSKLTSVNGNRTIQFYLKSKEKLQNMCIKPLIINISIYNQWSNLRFVWIDII